MMIKTTTHRLICEEDGCENEATTFSTSLCQFRCRQHTVSEEENTMNIVHKICDFLYFADTITPFEKGRLYAQEAAKLDTYNTNPENVRELIEAEGIERHWGAFINGVIQEEQRLAIESGRVYCDECSGYYMPHEH